MLCTVLGFLSKEGCVAMEGVQKTERQMSWNPTKFQQAGTLFPGVQVVEG